MESGSPRRPIGADILRSAVYAFVTLVPALLASLALEQYMSARGASLIFIAAVVGCAARFGFFSGIISAVLCFLALNFFFIEPRHTLLISDPAEFFSLGVFLIVASITGSLAGRLREQVTSANRRAHLLQIVSEFSGTLLQTKTGADVLLSLCGHLGAVLSGPVALLRNAGADIEIAAVSPKEMPRDSIDVFSAEQVFRKGHAVLAAAPGWGGNRFEYRPLAQAGLRDLVLAVAPSGGNRTVPQDAEQTLATMLDQASLALERMRFSDATDDARAQAQEEKLRSTLLSSVSHDLRTPLAAILGSVTSLREFGAQMPERAKDELLEAIESETRRLSRLVANLLDMTKLQSGLVMRGQWVDAADMVRSAIAAINKSFPGRIFEAKVEKGLAPVECDAALFGQVLFNLMENAAKYSPVSSPVTVEIRAEGAVFVLEVADQGPGIAPRDRRRIFEKFVRGDKASGGVRGAGLGLAICRGIVEAMGGSIFVADTGRAAGATLRVELPMSPKLKSTSAAAGK